MKISWLVELTWAMRMDFFSVFFFQAEDGIRDWSVTGVQTCALPISESLSAGQRNIAALEALALEALALEALARRPLRIAILQIAVEFRRGRNSNRAEGEDGDESGLDDQDRKSIV